MKKNISNSAEALKKLVEELSFEIKQVEALEDHLLDLDLDQLILLRSTNLRILFTHSKIKKLLFELRNLPKFER